MSRASAGNWSSIVSTRARRRASSRASLVAAASRAAALASWCSASKARAGASRVKRRERWRPASYQRTTQRLRLESNWTLIASRPWGSHLLPQCPSVVSRKSAPPLETRNGPDNEKAPQMRGFRVMRRRGLEPPPTKCGPGPQPGNPGVISVLCVQIVQIVRESGRIGRNGRSGCCRGCCHGYRGG